MPKGVYDHSEQGKRGPNTAMLFLKAVHVSTTEHRAVLSQTKMAEESLAANRCPSCSSSLADHACSSCGFKLVLVPYSGPDTRKIGTTFFRRPTEK